MVWWILDMADAETHNTLLQTFAGGDSKLMEAAENNASVSHGGTVNLKTEWVRDAIDRIRGVEKTSVRQTFERIASTIRVPSEAIGIVGRHIDDDQRGIKVPNSFEERHAGGLKAHIAVLLSKLSL